MKKLLLFALLAATPALAITVKQQLVANSDSTFNTAYPNGDKPIGGSACSTWTCDSIGDAVPVVLRGDWALFSMLCDD